MTFERAVLDEGDDILPESSELLLRVRADQVKVDVQGVRRVGGSSDAVGGELRSESHGGRSV